MTGAAPSLPAVGRRDDGRVGVSEKDRQGREQ